jgi:hypothetical protein
MARQVLKNVKLYLGQYDVSGDFNSVQLGLNTEGLDVTAFGATAKVETPGLESVELTGKAFWQQDATPGSLKIEDILLAKFALQNTPVSVAPLAAAVGDLAWFFQALVANYDPGFVIGQVPMADITAKASGGRLVRGSVLENTTSVAGGNGTAVQLGAVLATQRVYAALHVFALSGGTLTVKVQSDDANGMATPTDRLTFASVTGPGSEIVSAAGAITDTWWRRSHTLTGGSATFALMTGIL